MEREFARRILNALDLTPETFSAIDALLESLDRMIRDRLSEPILPKDGESLALSLRMPKTAALAFDRVYRSPLLADPVPKEIGFFGATEPEVALMSIVAVAFAAQQVGVELPQRAFGGDTEDNRAQNLRLLCSRLPSAIHAYPTILYDDVGSVERDYPAGSQEILTAAIRDIALVDEGSLAWEQVLEFRSDVQASRRYRRLIRWVDAKLLSQSASAVCDEIADRIEDYEWALRKHGIKTLLGAVSCLLDPRFVKAVSVSVATTAFATSGVWAALAGAVLVAGKAAVSFGTQWVDSLDHLREEGHEVAYIHEVKRRLAS